MRHPVANPIASLPGASQPGRLGKTQVLYSAIACEGKTSALLPYPRSLCTCKQFIASASTSSCDQDGHTCAAEYLEAKLQEMEKKLQNVEQLMHGSLQPAVLLQPQMPVSVDGTMIAHSDFSMSELRPSSLQVPRSALLALLSCLQPMALRQSLLKAMSRSKTTQALTLSCGRPAALLLPAAQCQCCSPAT